jgi:hypothetical protein
VKVMPVGGLWPLLLLVALVEDALTLVLLDAPVVLVEDALALVLLDALVVPVEDALALVLLVAFVEAVVLVVVVPPPCPPLPLVSDIAPPLAQLNPAAPPARRPAAMRTKPWIFIRPDYPHTCNIARCARRARAAGTERGATL